MFFVCLQKQYPARIKKIHYYNVGNFMEILMTFIRLGLSEKIRNRVSSISKWKKKHNEKNK